MYDIHSHILPNTDDGPSNLEKTMEVIYAANRAGIEGIVCTPHYIDDKYCNSSSDNLIKLNSVKNAIALNDMNIKIYLGNEVLISPDIVDLIEKREIMTLNNSRYILIEMPVHSKPIFTNDIIFKIKLKGMIPIIAHPERYEWVMKSPQDLTDIMKKGCLTQLNISSVNGYYGERVRKIAKALLEEKRICFLGSDSHSSDEIYNSFINNINLLHKIVPTYMLEEMIYNSEAAINNQDIKTK